jgi:hypothetical protein
MAAIWMIEQLKPIQRGSLEHGTQPVMAWRPVPYYGFHEDRLSAMRRWITENDPDWAGMPDDRIQRQWRAWSRSFGLRTVQAPAWAATRLAARWYVADGLWHAPCGTTELDWLKEGCPLPEDPNFPAWASAFYHYDAIDADELAALEQHLAYVRAAQTAHP